MASGVQIDPIVFDNGSLSAGVNTAGLDTGGWFSRGLGGLADVFGNKGSDWAGVAGAAVAGAAANKYDNAIQDAKYAANRKELEMERKNNREVLGEQMATDYFQNRMNRERKRQGVNSFRQFNKGVK